MLKNHYSRLFKKPLTLLAIGLGFAASAQNLPTAKQTYDAMTVGWNLGNTLEAIGGETAWGNPMTTQNLINKVKAAGFNTVRLPVAWDIHANQSTGVIDATWMARVKQVVDYCINADVYVIINIHWDNGWLEKNCTPAMQTSVNAKQKNYWTQIANTFKNYDGRLLFASANEPHVENAEQMTVLLSYHQTFIDAVRATGGNNASRTLIVQGPITDIEKTNTLMNTMPKDKIANRLIAEIHFYTPYQFCLLDKDGAESWSKMYYYWGKNNHSTTDATRNATWGEEEEVDRLFQLMKTKFVDKGYPVIMGEIGAIKRTSLTGSAYTLHIKSREFYYEYITKSARCHGILPVFWDTGALNENNMTLINRNTGAIADQGTVNAIMKGASVCKTITALEETEVVEDLVLYPNPSSADFKFKLSPNSQIDRILVVDVLGNVVESIEQPNTGEISLAAALLPGLYTVQVQTGGKNRAFKVIKK